MKDFQHDEDSQLEKTLASIWKEFAYYLKETARKQEERINKLEDKFAELDKKIVRLEMELKNGFEKHDAKEKTGWTVVEKTIAILAFIITIGIAIIGIIMK